MGTGVLHGLLDRMEQWLIVVLFDRGLKAPFATKFASFFFAWG